MVTIRCALLPLDQRYEMHLAVAVSLMQGSQRHWPVINLAFSLYYCCCSAYNHFLRGGFGFSQPVTPTNAMC